MLIVPRQQNGYGRRCIEVCALELSKEGMFMRCWEKVSCSFYINNRKVLDVNELDNLKSSAVKSIEVIQAPGNSMVLLSMLSSR